MTIGALILAGLSLQAPPEAKGQAEICGATSCRKLYGTETKPAVNILTQARRARLSPAAPTQFFSIRFVNQPGSPLAYWMPTANRLRVGWERAIWIRPTESKPHSCARTYGLRPLSAPKSVSVAVNLKPVRNDLSYLRLYTLGHVTTKAADNGGWLKINIFGRSTPWTDGKNSLWISRRGAFLRRNGQIDRDPDHDRCTGSRARLPLTDV